MRRFILDRKNYLENFQTTNVNQEKSRTLKEIQNKIRRTIQVNYDNIQIVKVNPAFSDRKSKRDAK